MPVLGTNVFHAAEAPAFHLAHRHVHVIGGLERDQTLIPVHTRVGQVLCGKRESVVQVFHRSARAVAAGIVDCRAARVGCIVEGKLVAVKVAAARTALEGEICFSARPAPVPEHGAESLQFLALEFCDILLHSKLFCEVPGVLVCIAAVCITAWMCAASAVPPWWGQMDLESGPGLEARPFCCIFTQVFLADLRDI